MSQPDAHEAPPGVVDRTPPASAGRLQRIWRGYFGFIGSLYDQQVPATGLALFRIAYAAVLAWVVLDLLKFNRLIFDPIPYLAPAELELYPVLKLWLLVAGALLLGFMTRIAALINYVLLVTIIGGLGTFHYHTDYVLTICACFLIFAPTGQTLSIDRLVRKLRYSTPHFDYSPPATVGRIHYLLFVVFALGLIYFDSVFHKLGSWSWMAGLGVWLPSSLPHVAWHDFSFLLDQEYLVRGLGYFVILYEFLFIFLIWLAPVRWPLIIAGLGLHLGIAVAYPIPQFGLVEAIIFILLVPATVLARFGTMLRSPRPTLCVYFDEECPLCQRVRLVIEHFDVRQSVTFLGLQTHADDAPALRGLSTPDLLATLYSVDARGRRFQGLQTYEQIFRRVWVFWPVAILLLLPPIRWIASSIYRRVAAQRLRNPCGVDCVVDRSEWPREPAAVRIVNDFTLRDLRVIVIGVAVLLLTAAQGIMISQATGVGRLATRVGLGDEWQATRGEVYDFSRFTRRFLGVNMHNVFMDTHFNGYNHVLAVIYRAPDGSETWLPIVDERGRSGAYNLDRFWLKWTFRSSGSKVNQELLRRGIERYTAFWAIQNGVDLTSSEFVIRVKKVAIPQQWERGVLKRQYAQPWIDGGVARWQDSKMSLQMAMVEKL